MIIMKGKDKKMSEISDFKVTREFRLSSEEWNKYMKDLALVSSHIIEKRQSEEIIKILQYLPYDKFHRDYDKIIKGEV